LGGHGKNSKTLIDYPTPDEFKQTEEKPRVERIFAIERVNVKRMKKLEDDCQEAEALAGETPSVPNPGGESFAPVDQSQEGATVQTATCKSTSSKKRDVKGLSKCETAHIEETKELPVDDISESQDRKRKKHKTTEYFYLLERKALRMMRRYYKEAFEKYASKYKYKQNLKRLPKNLVDGYFKEYVILEFARNPLALDMLGCHDLVLALETIILCDRYNKGEQVTEGLDFDQIRNLLNKYNSKNLKEFFSNPAHAFLFSHYHRLSSKDDAEAQKHVDHEKLSQQMESLFSKSLKALPGSLRATVTRKDY
jgi:hypothetical protein